MDDMSERACSGERPASGPAGAVGRFPRSCGAMLARGARGGRPGGPVEPDGPDGPDAWPPPEAPPPEAATPDPRSGRSSRRPASASAEPPTEAAGADDDTDADAAAVADAAALAAACASLAAFPASAGTSSSATTSVRGSSTTAEVPPYPETRSEILTLCLAASRLTTNSPSWSLSARSNSGGFASRWLSVSMMSGGMPRPRSSISTTYPLATRPPLTWTLVPGGEY